MKKQISTKNKLTGITIAILTRKTCAAADNKLVIDGSNGPLARWQGFAEYYMSENPDVNITISESGTTARKVLSTEYVISAIHAIHETN